MDNIGARLYLLGSDYIYSGSERDRKDEVTSLGGTILGELTCNGSNDVKEAVRAIKAGHPSVIINSITGTPTPYYSMSCSAQVSLQIRCRCYRLASPSSRCKECAINMGPRPSSVTCAPGAISKA